MAKPIRACVVIAVAACAACSSGPSPEADPAEAMVNETLSLSQRVEAMDRAWNKAANPAERRVVRRNLETIAWSPAAETPLRLKAIELMLSDTDERGLAQSREALKAMLARQSNRAVVATICQAAAGRGWTDFVPAITRSFSQAVPGTPDAERSELAALKTLAGDRPIEELVFGVFMEPPKQGSTLTVNWEEQHRADAWEVLCRLDPEGSRRDALVASASANATGEAAAVLADLAAARADLRASPLTGDELRWLRRLRDPKIAHHRAWWQEASRAIAVLDGERSSGLMLRHAEPIRWSAAHKPEWLAASRDTLVSELATRLSARPIHVRRAERGTPGGEIPERLSDTAPRLAWADALSVLVADEAVRSPAVRAALFRYLGYDRDDTTTEYGGVIDAGGDGAFRATLYPPRPAQRKGDDLFVASTDMILASDIALLHYHFHAADVDNARYAGPSPLDLDYATSLGRNCVVLTSLSRDRLAVDYYQPGGVVVDLGELSTP